jgi:DNA-binding transcriptional regulator YiaG
MRKYKSEIYEVIHQDAMADFEVGAISDDRMKEYDDMCFVEEPEADYSAEKSTVLKHVTA